MFFGHVQGSPSFSFQLCFSPRAFGCRTFFVRSFRPRVPHSKVHVYRAHPVARQARQLTCKGPASRHFSTRTLLAHCRTLCVRVRPCFALGLRVLSLPSSRFVRLSAAQSCKRDMPSTRLLSRLIQCPPRSKLELCLAWARQPLQPQGLAGAESEAECVCSAARQALSSQDWARFPCA